MAVLGIEQYRQRNGEDILKVILKPTKTFLKGYFYADACDEELVRSCTWRFNSQRNPCIVADAYGRYKLQFHQEKAHNILGYYPACINHINMIEFDNVNRNIDAVTSQQNQWAKPSKGYRIHIKGFRSEIMVNQRHIYTSCVKTEIEACQGAYYLELKYEDYRYDFLRDRRNYLDILDLERTGGMSTEEAVYRHVTRYALDNAWYIYRYNLFDYFKANHLAIPPYSVDSEGFMIHSITGKRLCPL